MADRSHKRSVICISSSSSSEEEEQNDDDSEENEEEISGDDDDDASNYTGDGDEAESDDDNCSVYEDDDDDVAKENDESLCQRVICFLKEGKDLEALSLQDYKAYLRKHGLRLAGTKSVCLSRVKDHWRIKDGNGESLYPRSSFVINCTGDVCNGDVVLFTQKVYKKFDKVIRHGNLLGKRTVAGRVVNESYGSAKQQHTFTHAVDHLVIVIYKVEVLWSKGAKKLPPLYPLLVKGRNLYRLKTFRQRWNNEAERQEVLAEKHKRGTAARLVRAMKKSKKKLSETGRSNVKRQKCSHHTRPSRTIETAEPGRKKHAYGHKKDTSQQHGKVHNHRHTVPHSRQLNLKRHNKSGTVGSNPTQKRLKVRHLDEGKDPAARHAYAYAQQSPYPPQREYHNPTVAFHFSHHDMGSTSIMPPWRAYANTVAMPAFEDRWSNHINDIHHDRLNHPSNNFGRANSLHFSEFGSNHQSSRGRETYAQRKRSFQHYHR
ncbi:zinc finger CCCH domain-containing protein 62 isoform X2 [Mercurialis annua]|uniref:zinc finger CCCH domain-containing protein 62 isoform X2 n=1 Tax=Mercurialis annua TaxID=3986 RepID=UPI0021610B07|nr:zinc finger CCCH domain-containing protein 62 isoform X2 [Mercurialis annua]